MARAAPILQPLSGWDMKWLADVYVVENQQIYGHLQSRGDPNDLLELAHVSGVVHGRVLAAHQALKTKCVVLRPKPREWKGTITKIVHHNRLRAKYPSAEDMMDLGGVPESKRHNVWDAIGLGDWALKKIGVENEIKKI